MKCSQCGAELPKDAKFCLECGAKLLDEEGGELKEDDLKEGNFKEDIQNEADVDENEKENISANVKNRNKKKYLLIGIIIAIAIISIFGYTSYKKQLALEAYNERVKKYKANLLMFRMNTLADGAEFEEMCNKYLQVWHDAIFVSKKDFNDEIEKQHAAYEEKNNELKNNKEMLDQIVKELQNPPEGYEKAYDAVVEMHGVYDEFYRLATSPSGSYKSYSDEFSEVDSRFLKVYNKLEILIPVPDKESDQENIDIEK